MNGVLLVDGIVVSAYVDYKADGLFSTARSLGMCPTLISHVSLQRSNCCLAQAILSMEGMYHMLC